MKEILIQSVYFLTPIMIINGSLNFLSLFRRKSNYFKKLDYPIDFGAYFFDSRRVLGDSTTFPGLLLAIIVGILFGQFYFSNIFLGIISGLCVFFGHAIGSFIKRRFGFKDGEFMPMVDHIDYVVCVGIVFIVLKNINIEIFLTSIVITLIIHPVFCYIGFKIGIRTLPY